MNGVTDDYMVWLYSDDRVSRPDDDELTDEGQECPFCGHPVDVVETGFVCGNCIVSWNSIGELEQERETLAAQGWAQ